LVFGRGLAWLRASWANGSITPLICPDTAFELLDVLAYPKFKLSIEKRDELLKDYLPYAEIHTLPAPLPALPSPCRDLDDEFFLYLAIAGGADVLVTGDGDLLALRDAAPVRIVTVRDLREMLGT